LLTAPSDLELGQPRRRPPSSRRRTVAAIGGVLVLTMPVALAVPAAVSAPKSAVSVRAVAVRSVLTGDDAFDRPSSAALGAAQIEALSARTLTRASRNSARVVPASALALLARDRARPNARPKAPPKKKAPAQDRWVRPGNGRFTSGFKRRWGRWHKGIDLAAPTGSPIVAAADGVVIFAGPMNGFGRLVLIRHSSTVVTAYGHMSAYRTHVGEHVKAGELIALVGSAGHSTGPHLHFEVRINGVQVNPRPFLAKHRVFL
jgi:murein DD-endopeptidase MepM/ murein hydrolase activator NlpD